MELSAEVSTILQVIFINVVLSGDNAIVVGMAAAGAPIAIRKKVIFYGIAGAVVLRVLLSLLAVQFLQVVGLLLAGGVLLLWVSLEALPRDPRKPPRSMPARGPDGGQSGDAGSASSKTLGQAMWQIHHRRRFDVARQRAGDRWRGARASADHGGRAGAFVALMGLAATFIAGLLDRYRWLAWVGLLVIVYVAARMIWEGGRDIEEAVLVFAALGLPLPLALKSAGARRASSRLVGARARIRSVGIRSPVFGLFGRGRSPLLRGRGRSGSQR